MVQIGRYTRTAKVPMMRYTNTRRVESPNSQVKRCIDQEVPNNQEPLLAAGIFPCAGWVLARASTHLFPRHVCDGIISPYRRAGRNGRGQWQLQIGNALPLRTQSTLQLADGSRAPIHDRGSTADCGSTATTRTARETVEKANSGFSNLPVDNSCQSLRTNIKKPSSVKQPPTTTQRFQKRSFHEHR